MASEARSCTFRPDIGFVDLSGLRLASTKCPKFVGTSMSSLFFAKIRPDWQDLAFIGLKVDADEA